MADSLIIKFGGDTSEFRGALASMAAETQSKFTVMDAAAGRSERSGMGASLRGLHHGVREFHALLTAGGSATLIKEFFHTAIEYAEHTKEALDDNTAAVLRFKDSLKGSGEFFGHMAAEAVGFLNRIGEAEGSLRRGLFEYITGNKNAFKEANDELKSADEAGRNIAKIEAEKKKNGEEYKRINTEITSEHNKQKALANEAIPAQERSIKLAKEYQRLVSERGTEGGLEGRKKDLEIEKARTEAKKAAKDAEKEGRAEEKKAAEHIKENQDAAIQFADHMNSLKDREHKLAMEILPPNERLKKLTEERAALSAEIEAGARDEETILEDKIKLHEHDLEIVKLTAQIEEEGRKKAKTATIDLGVARLIGGQRRYFKAADQRAEEELQRRSAMEDTNRDIEGLQNTVRELQTSGNTSGRYELPALQARIKALTDRRAHINDYVFNPNYSDAAGQGIFAQQVATTGDPLGLQKKSTDTLGDISTRLATIDQRLHVAGFGKTPAPGQGSY